MAPLSPARATLDDLARTEGKAELINGRIELAMPTGDLPSDVANEIYVSLRTYAKTGLGRSGWRELAVLDERFAPRSGLRGLYGA